MKIVYSPECLEYNSPGHPESPERVKRIYDALKAEGYEFVKPEPATEKDILLVHSEEHYRRVEKGDYESIETPPIDIKYPLLSAGAAIKAMDVAGFALTRPPGHHAGRDTLEGFCYFNNTAIAVRKSGKRTAILDLDTHHGNGTQSIFLGSRDVLYVSLHQAPLYPMTGLKSDGNCLNFPLFPETPEKVYIETLKKAMERIVSFRPDMLAVSMGFDTYEKDPLAGQKVTEKGYRKIGEMISALGIPLFVVLEGGYSEDIGKLCSSFLSGFG
ncbi:MAG: histone deacetylase family protein [Candidatus Aenigmarchaeota archaeon]|nr:histone deacetylase family protein [Candidatus Aenigmarchaeota archaeon]